MQICRLLLSLLWRSFQPRRQPARPCIVPGKMVQHNSDRAIFILFKTRWALKDGKISVSERRLLWFLGVSTSIMLLADLIVVIWVPKH